MTPRRPLRPLLLAAALLCGVSAAQAKDIRPPVPATNPATGKLPEGTSPSPRANPAGGETSPRAPEAGNQPGNHAGVPAASVASGTSSTKATTAAAASPSSATPAVLRPRTMPSFDRWSVACTNSGLCTASALIRDRSVWLDLRIVRNWPAEAPALVRITANAALNGDKALKLWIDGKAVDEIQVAQLRESQAAITAPLGFRPLGGEGFWYPAGPATDTLLRAMVAGKTLRMDLPIGEETVSLQIPLKGLMASLSWLDDQQRRTGTTSAIQTKGEALAQDAPHALPIVDPATLPPAIAAAWDANRFCSDVDPGIFPNLDAVAAPLDDKLTLYLLPCGAPGAYNAAYVALLAGADGKTRQLSFARMSDQGPVAMDLLYNLHWDAPSLELDSLFRGSGIGDCGVWSRWRWTGSAFALTEEASRSTCDGQETPLSEWGRIWPPATESN